MSNLYAFEKKIVEAEEMGLKVFEDSFEGNTKGLCIDNIIFFDKALSWPEKNCVITEETGHALFNAGDITDQSKLVNRKQERRGRIYAYDRLVPIDKLIEAFESGCYDIYEAVEFLDVSERFFKEAMHYYYGHYGMYVREGDYVLRFNEDSVYIEKIGAEYYG